MSRIIMGCMRINAMETTEINRLIHKAMEQGITHFDHSDIYGNGVCEEMFCKAIEGDASIKRDEIFIQSKCGIRQGFYDLSKEHILRSVDEILGRLGVEYLDQLLLHRPDALVEPEEVAEAFDILEKSGKVRRFGVSNFKPMQIELLKKCVTQDIAANQLQFSIPVSNMVANGMEVNMTTEGAVDRDGSVLDYCRLNDITIQAWSPFQKPAWQGTFIDNGYDDLNRVLWELAEKYGVTKTGIATAWVLRHPAKMQLITGTTNEARLCEIAAGAQIELTREEWYQLYLAAGHNLP